MPFFNFDQKWLFLASNATSIANFFYQKRVVSYCPIQDLSYEPKMAPLGPFSQEKKSNTYIQTNADLRVSVTIFSHQIHQ